MRMYYFHLFVLQIARLRDVILREEGSYHNGRLRCRFTVDRDIGFYYPEVPLISGGPYHLLMARGFSRKGMLVCLLFLFCLLLLLLCVYVCVCSGMCACVCVCFVATLEHFPF